MTTQQRCQFPTNKALYRKSKRDRYKCGTCRATKINLQNVEPALIHPTDLQLSRSCVHGVYHGIVFGTISLQKCVRCDTLDLRCGVRLRKRSVLMDPGRGRRFHTLLPLGKKTVVGLFAGIKGRR